MDQQTFTFEGNSAAWYKTGTGKPILILHGWGSSSAVMTPLAKKLSDIRTCYLVDFPGFGNSPEPAEAWDVDKYADFTEAFIHTVIQKDSIDILVHSYGNRVLLKLLNRSIRDIFDKIIITGGAGLKPKRSAKYYGKKYIAKVLKAPFTVLPGKMREKGLKSLRSTNLWKSLGSSDYKQLSGVMRETFVKSVTEFLDDLLPKIEHEALLIWGRADTATPLYQAFKMEKELKNGVLVQIENAGHYAFLDQPEQFISICRAYLEPENQQSI
ncbi:MAG: alpha/beta hydrolase [Rhodohalobacter sp.]|uniref:alpha/beta fold hydrolase n=1 Tax=Rhodohalobacter sp. TaxID=1974210 RepID=UPI003975E625